MISERTTDVNNYLEEIQIPLREELLYFQVVLTQFISQLYKLGQDFLDRQ